MALTHSSPVPLGSIPVDFSLPATDGDLYNLDSFQDADILVIFFWCNHCPFILAVEDLMIDLSRKYKGQKVQFVAINANDAETYPDDSFEKMIERFEQKKYSFIYLYDETQEVAKAYEAQCTPDTFVYNKDRKLVYHGRINDASRGEKVSETNDLEEALQDILAGKEVQKEQIPSIGCNIKWK